MAIEPFLGTRPQKILLGTVITECTIVLVMVALAFGFCQEDIYNASNLTAYKTLPCYFALFVLATVFTIYSALDSLWNRNVIELIGMVIFSIGICVFSGIQIREVRIALVLSSTCLAKGFDNCTDLFDLVEGFLIVVPVVIGIAIASYVWLTRKLFDEFGWAVFHTIGADPRMKYMYRFYEIFVCLLKFDYFAVVALTMQLTILVLNYDTTEYALTIAAIPITLILLIGCGWSVKQEIRSIMVFSLALMLAAMAYILYKLTRFWVGPHAYLYSSTRGTLTFFSIISFIMLGTTFGVGVRLMFFFGQGLREAHEESPEKRRRARLFRQRRERIDAANAAGGEAVLRKERPDVGVPLEPRMSID